MAQTWNMNQTNHRNLAVKNVVAKCIRNITGMVWEKNSDSASNKTACANIKEALGDLSEGFLMVTRQGARF